MSDNRDDIERRRADLERRLDAGDWLSPGEIALVLKLGRTTVHQMMVDGKIAYRKTAGGHREGDPSDVRRLLAERRRIYRGGTE